MFHEVRIDRRTAFACFAGCIGMAATGATRAMLAEEPTRRTGLGMVIYNCALRRRWLQEQDSAYALFEPLTFLQHCQSLGTGGMQASLGVLSPKRIEAVGEFADQHGLFIEAIVQPPRDKGDISRFEAEIRTAAEVGALAVRTVIIPGRRYEQFTSLDEFKAAAEKGRQMVRWAAPIVEKHRVRLAVENHKDQRIDERVALLKEFDSEFIGACVDTGNNIALLDDPDETVEALAPFAFSVHLKDQAVRKYEDGFLLGDIPLGKGCLDLKRMVGTLRKAKPNLPMVLELITRDPLRVPCLSDHYWATLPTVPGRHLARTLRMVQNHSADYLQQVSSLSLEYQVKLEDANIAESLKHARERLDL